MDLMSHHDEWAIGHYHNGTRESLASSPPKTRSAERPYNKSDLLSTERTGNKAALVSLVQRKQNKWLNAKFTHSKVTVAELKAALLDPTYGFTTNKPPVAAPHPSRSIPHSARPKPAGTPTTPAVTDVPGTTGVESLRAENTEGLSFFDFFYASHVHLLGEFGLFLAVRVQNMSHAGCSITEGPEYRDSECDISFKSIGKHNIKSSLLQATPPICDHADMMWGHHLGSIDVITSTQYGN
ncbi:hypothetical protein C8R44DRAFT_742846 [Mycena epipterygia]|nr:hypothetical protein C8R44DRAFT_742846 [Mycena epipterygia]